MNLREKEMKVRSLIEEKIEYGDSLVLRQEELRKWDVSPREISLILEKFLKEKRIRDYAVRPSVRIWTTPEYWKHPNLKNLRLRYDSDKRAMLYGEHLISIGGKKERAICAAILKRPHGRFIDEDDILDDAFSDYDTTDKKFRRTVRDAVIRLNTKVNGVIGRKDLFLFQGSKVRVNV